MIRDHHRAVLLDSFWHVFGAENRVAVSRIKAEHTRRIESIVAHIPRDRADLAAVAAFFGWMRLTPDARARRIIWGRMWEADPEPGILDARNAAARAGWILCQLVTAPRRRWPPQWSRPLVVVNDTEENRARYAALLADWWPVQLGPRPARRAPARESV